MDFSGTPENSKEPLPEVSPNLPNSEPAHLSSELEKVKNQNNEALPVFDFGMEPKVDSNPGSDSFEVPSSEAPSVVESAPITSTYENFWSHEASGGKSAEVRQGGVEEPRISSSINSSSVSFDEVQDFGNNNKNYEGVLSFDLKIEGIDLSTQKKILLECIEDSRLGLDLEEVKKRLDSGVVEILDFPAAKTIVLVQRLQGQGFEITWREHVSTQ
ncbi:MAG: hypothetical protein L6Q37_09620 [Bdellovibrionaceae bacterium]|nr:hypothetical protein [Pseudobdellovibrionaceae bacterium]